VRQRWHDDAECTGIRRVYASRPRPAQQSHPTHVNAVKTLLTILVALLMTLLRS